MTLQPVRLYKSTGSDRAAVVSVEPATQPASEEDRFLIRVARGPKASLLTGGTAYGPYTESELRMRFDEVVAEQERLGFSRAGFQDLLAALDSQDSAVRARAALRLGWRRSTDAVPVLLAKMDSAVDDLCSIIDALGAIGDLRAIDALRKQAERKLLSRRRSAVEALRGVEDVVGLAEAQDRALQRLPDALRQAVDDNFENPAPIKQAVLAEEKQRLGLYLDTLYEIGSPACIAAVRDVLDDTSFARPYIWRYVKSILLRSKLRHDAAMFGWLAHRVEVQSRTLHSVTANVKSGYDGQARETEIFSLKTRNYVRRSNWRYLRNLARYRSSEYTAAAAEALIHYREDDTREPKRRLGRFSHCFLFSQILFGASSRFVYDDRRLVFRFQKNWQQTKAPSGVREERFPELWDAYPRPYLRLLSESSLLEVHQFAIQAIKDRHPELVQQATADELAKMLAAAFEPTMLIALHEINRRFDPSDPDWVLLDRLVADDREFVVEIAHEWLRQTAPIWTSDIDRICRYLEAGNGKTQLLAVELLTEHLTEDALKQVLAERLLDRLRDRQAENLEGVARAARTVIFDQIDKLLSTPEVLSLLAEGSTAAQSVAAEVLARRPGAAQELGMGGVVALADHEVFYARSAAHHLLRSVETELRTDPSPLFTLVESRWDDSRSAGMELLDEMVDWTTTNIDVVIGLLDSNREDVQAFGIEKTRANFDNFDADELTYRLVQHPHANMRRFALELVEQHLPDGHEALSRLDRFFRAGLFDTWPQRKVKHGIIQFLLDRGLNDLEQAKVASGILNDFVRVRGQGDFERTLEALTRLKLAHPEVAADVSVAMEGAL